MKSGTTGLLRNSMGISPFLFSFTRKYGGRYLTRGGKITPITGNWNPEKIVVVEFEAIEQLQIG